MRKTIKIIGIGTRRAGTSKAGKAYDFTPVSIAYRDDNTTGHRAETVNMNTPDIPAGMTPGVELDAVMHFSKNRLYIDAIL